MKITLEFFWERTVTKCDENYFRRLKTGPKVKKSRELVSKRTFAISLSRFAMCFDVVAT